MSAGSKGRKINITDDEDVKDEAHAEESSESEARADDAAEAPQAEETPAEETADYKVPIEELDVEALLRERDELAAEQEELRDQLLRARAEFDNFRKRIARDSERMRKTAAADIIRDLLPIADNLELALQHVSDPQDSLAQGVQMVVKQFMEVLQRAGLEPIAAEGESFDPTVHEAVMQQESDDVAANKVVKEFQRGYRLGDLVLRPSKVVVSSGPVSAGQTGETQE